MSKIRVKIVDYETESNSLIVCFASDKSKKSIDEYPQLAYQPTMFDNPEDPEAIMKELARIGISQVDQQDKEEAFCENKILEQRYCEYIGKQVEYNIDELFAEQVIEEQTLAQLDEEQSEIDQILQDISGDDQIDLEDGT